MQGFFNKFKYIIILLLFLTIVSISFINYQNTKEIIKNKYNNRQQLVEKSILSTIHHINDAYRIAEKHLNQEMKKYSLILREKYRRNEEVLDWDLEKLKKRFNGYDIYIINRNLKVIKTTLEKDLGLDFKGNPGFAKLLRKRLQGDSFAVDRLDISINTGKIKKYSYMPTPDHKYLLELSINIKQKFPALKNLNIFANAVDITQKYKSVKEISFYKFNPDTKAVGKLRSTKKPYINTDISKSEKKYVRRAFMSNEVQREVDRSVENIYASKYIPVLVSAHMEENWWNSYVVGITYNNQIMFEEISKQRNLFLVNTLIMTGVFIVFIVIVTYLLRRFEYMAYHDQLTGLPNRKSFVEEFDKLITEARKNDNKLAILFLDIDDFKEVNNNFGHDIGDKLLKKVADRLKESLREKDTVSRLGGDEFTIAVNGINSRQDVNEVATRIIEGFKKALIIEESKFFISVSLGISIYPEDGRELEELIKKADYAMYKAKKQRDDYIFYKKEA